MIQFAPCRHIFTDGHQCGSPALRGQPLCYYHTAGRQPLPVKKSLGRVTPILPAPDDLHAIQIGYAHLLRLIAEDEIDHRAATLLLNTLSRASANIVRIHRREQTHPTVPVTDLAQDPTHGTLAPMQSVTQTPSEVLPEVQTSPDPTLDFDRTSPQQNEDFTEFQQSLQNSLARHEETATPNREQPATPVLRQSPEPPPTPPTGPLTLNDQFVIADRANYPNAKARREALDAITQRLLAPAPEDLARDREIRAARAQAQSHQNPAVPPQTQSPTHEPQRILTAA